MVITKSPRGKEKKNQFWCLPSFQARKKKKKKLDPGL
jgi:hypothetical protein